MDAIVFGMGDYFRTKEEDIHSRYEIIGYIDSTVKVGESKISADGKRIVNPKEWMLLPDADILLMSQKFFEMWKILMDLGVRENRLKFGMEFAPAYNPLEEELKQDKAEIRAEHGAVVLSIDGKEYCFTEEKQMRTHIRGIYQMKRPEMKAIGSLPVKPISRIHGREHGTPIDRYYIERFIQENRDKIHGVVAEIGDDGYTRKFGTDVCESLILHVNGWGDHVLKTNFITGEGIQENRVDCLIYTQTIQLIYEVENVVENIYRILRPEGSALITAHGIAQLSMYDYRHWGEYWRFSDKALERLFEYKFETEKIQVHSYGNVKIAAAMLYGLAVEDMETADFAYDDEQYPVMNTVLVRK